MATVKDIYCYINFTPIAMESKVDHCDRNKMPCKGIGCTWAGYTHMGKTCLCAHERRGANRQVVIGTTTCCSPFFEAQGKTCVGPTMCAHAHSVV